MHLDFFLAAEAGGSLEARGSEKSGIRMFIFKMRDLIKLKLWNRIEEKPHPKPPSQGRGTLRTIRKLLTS